MPRSNPRQRHRQVCLRGMSYVCDICGNELDHEEPLVVLAGNESSDGIEKGFIHPFRKKHARNSQPWEARQGKWRLCQQLPSHCSTVHTLAEPGSVIHPDCLRVFMRNCSAKDVLDRLWQTCVWRRVPWKGARVPALRVRLRPVWHWIDSFVPCAEDCGVLSRDTPMPQVVLGQIMESLPRDHVFWRYVSALDLAQRLSDAQLQPLRIFELHRMASWERGTVPQLIPDASLGRVRLIIRLTFDHDGLMKFERLLGWPDFDRERFDNRAFIVEYRTSFSWSMLAKFKNGLLQLTLPEGPDLRAIDPVPVTPPDLDDGLLGRHDPRDPGLAVWDTPTPPGPHGSLLRPAEPYSWFRFHTIDLSTITGITFLLYKGIIAGIHAHTEREPCAIATYTMDNKMDSCCTWVYVPMPPGDSILSCGPLMVRRHGLTRWALPSNNESHWPHFLIRKRLSGEVAIGRHYNTDSDEHNTRHTYGYFLNKPDNPPQTLLCSIGSSSPFLNTSIIVLDRDGVQDGMIEEPRAYPLADPPHSRLQHSSAPLENVTRVHVFYSPASSLCMGMLLYYGNGGQRALGQCRLHVDSSEAYAQPSSIAILNYWGRRPKGVKVQFNGPGRPEDGAWLHCRMVGTLECWFTPSAAHLSVLGARLIPLGEDTADSNREGISG